MAEDAHFDGVWLDEDDGGIAVGGLAHRRRRFASQQLRQRGRIHQTPRLPELAACRPWLEAELELIKPAVLGALGATAARAIFGPDFRLLKQHGQFFPTRWSAKTIATLHPSAVLRGQDDAEQARLYAMLRDDLRLIAAA